MTHSLSSTAAERMRRLRWRRRNKMQCVRIQLSPESIDALIANGYLNKKCREDLREVAEAASAFISDALADLL
jgi:hypothetical protein